ncbi:MAG: tripartite tricarboxylate transporter TctB family protein [Syntrophaceae bacterium]|nr:tripartite tricarboxylate transporter TctB family protein [Syntrophaceae bacterium]
MADQPREDLFLGILIIGVAIFLILYSASLPIPGRWIDAPAAVPIGLSIILAGLGSGLMIKARSQGGRFFGAGSNGKAFLHLFLFLKNREFHRALFTIAFVLLFIVSISYLQFYPASLLFVVIGIRIYAPRIKWYYAVIVAFTTVVGLFAIFSCIFGLPLRLGVFEYLLKFMIGRTYL